MANEKFWIRNDWDRQIAESVFARDEYRLGELSKTDQRIHWVLDVGAHIGAFTRLVKHYWAEARVIAVEPDPTAEPYWHLNTSDLSGSFWHGQAIVPVGGPVAVKLFHSADQNAAANFVAEVVSEFTPLPLNRAFDEVPATNILDLLNQYDQPDLDLVKLDCEGAEAHILEDLSQAGYLHRIGFICGEWHYFESIPRIESALSATHHLTLYRHEHPWGSFFAGRR